MNSPPALLAQQHDMNPVMQQQMLQVHQKEAEQLQQAPLATQQAQPHKQTLQQAHAEAQQHFQQSHHAMESPAVPPPVQPSGTGIYAMVIMLAGLGLHALVHNALQHGTHFVTNAGICKDCATFLVLIVSWCDFLALAERFKSFPSGISLSWVNDCHMQTVHDIEGNQRSLGEFANKVAVVVNVASQCGFTESNYKGLQFLYDKYKDYDFTVSLLLCDRIIQRLPSMSLTCCAKATVLADHESWSEVGLWWHGMSSCQSCKTLCLQDCQHFLDWLQVLAFPCNQFGQQESGSDADIKQFVKDRYGITFPMFSKVDVNGPQTSQLFTFLKQSFPPWLGTAASGNKDLSWNFNKFLIGRNGMPIKHYPSELDYAQLEQDVYNELVKNQIN